MQRTKTIGWKRRATARALGLIAATAICVPRFAAAGVTLGRRSGPKADASPMSSSRLQFRASLSRRDVGFPPLDTRRNVVGAYAQNFGFPSDRRRRRPDQRGSRAPRDARRTLREQRHGATFVNDSGPATPESPWRRAATAVSCTSPRARGSTAASTACDNWSERASPPTNVDQGEIVFALAVDRNDAAFLYVSVLNVGVFASANGGDSWQQTGAATPALASTVSLVIDPSNQLRLLPQRPEVSISATMAVARGPSRRSAARPSATSPSARPTRAWSTPLTSRSAHEEHRWRRNVQRGAAQPAGLQRVTSRNRSSTELEHRRVRRRLAHAEHRRRCNLGRTHVRHLWQRRRKVWHRSERASISALRKAASTSSKPARRASSLSTTPSCCSSYRSPRTPCRCSHCRGRPTRCWSA